MYPCRLPVTPSVPNHIGTGNYSGLYASFAPIVVSSISAWSGRESDFPYRVGLAPTSVTQLSNGLLHWWPRIIPYGPFDTGCFRRGLVEPYSYHSGFQTLLIGTSRTYYLPIR
jgi:hypothetical protein